MNSIRRQVVCVAGGLVAGLMLASMFGGTGVLAQSVNQPEREPRPMITRMPDVARYQVSAYAHGTQSSAGHGCYIVDTLTGATWHIEGTRPPQKINDKLTP